MTSTSTARNFQPLQTKEELPDVQGAALTQSRETGDVIPNSSLENASVAKRAAPGAKPWAHFVAGGQVLQVHRVLKIADRT